MNKKQLLVVWCMAAAYIGWAVWAAVILLRSRSDVDMIIKKIPAVIKANLFFILPLVIISCAAVFFLQDKEQ